MTVHLVLPTMPLFPADEANAVLAFRRRRDERGFALVLSLALLSLIFILVITLTSYVSIELRRTQLREEAVLAQTHARLGLNVAWGELMKHVAPDQRITSQAELLAKREDASSPLLKGGKYWTGVVDANDKNASPVWLVSGSDPDPEALGAGSSSPAEFVAMVPPTDSSADDAVMVEKVNVYSHDGEASANESSSEPTEHRSTGGFAYWTGDEGLKAKINMTRGEDALTSSGFGVSLIPGLESLETDVPPKERPKLLSAEALVDVTEAIEEDTLRERFHDVTVHGHGVLADVKGGGLRRDLTAGLQPEAKDSEGKPVLTGDKQIFGPADSDGSEPGASGGAGYVPGRGFPELQGYEIWNNIRRNGGSGYSAGRGRRPLDPTSPYCKMVPRSSQSYSLLIEDLNDFDWDLRLDVLRLGDGNILLTLNYNSAAGFNHTVMDNRQNPVSGMTRCHYSQWRRGKTYSTIVQNQTEDVSLNPGGPLWDQLRDYYNLPVSSDDLVQPQVQMEDKVGVHPVVSRAQFFLFPTYEKNAQGKYQVYSHLMPAIVLWNPHDVDIAPSEYTVAVWNREQYGFGDEYRIYYNDRNICERNYYLWYPRKKGGPEGEILDQGRARVDIKGKNPDPGYPKARWPYIDLENRIGIDLVGPCRPGRIWTYLDTVPGETYEVRFPYGINKDDRPKPYVRRGIVSWDGVDMATFEGNTDLFTYGTPQDYVTFTAVATSNRTRLDFRSDAHSRKDGGFGRHGGRTCQGVTVGICTVKSSSGYPASTTVSTKYPGLMRKKTGFVLENVSGLKAGQAIVFTPDGEALYSEYKIGEAPNNKLKEGWNGGHTFRKRTGKAFDSDAKPTHGEVLLDHNDTYLALFKGAVDTDSSYNDPLLVLSMGRFKDETAPEQFPLISRKSSGRYSSGDLAGAVGRRFIMRYAAAETYLDESEDDRIRWLANYNPRASIFSPTPYEFSDQEGSSWTGSLRTIPNYRTDLARASNDDWEVPVSGSADYDNPFIAYSHLSGVTQGTLYEIPRGYDHEHFRSIGQFSHVDFSTKAHRLIREHLTFGMGVTTEKFAMRGLGYKPGYAVGNSLADPRIPLDATYVNLSDNRWAATEAKLDAGYHYDQSYLLNEALWDSYFLSTVPRSLTREDLDDPDFTLSNRRYKVRDTPRQRWRRAQELIAEGLHPLQAAPTIEDRRDDDLKAYDLAASMLLVDGAFNVNSTSVHAWSALLASFFGTKVKDKTGAVTETDYESPFLRMNQPHGAPVKAGDAVDSASDVAYLGYRSLSREEIRALATGIVAEVKRRGPFRSLAEFVNRTLPDPDAHPSDLSYDWKDKAMKGTLAAAIENSGLNKAFEDEVVPEEANRNLDRALGRAGKSPAGSAAASGPAASHAPGYLTQADLLTRLGPALSARSDTFRVRVFGEAGNPVGDGGRRTSSRLRCEAVFQRLPEAAVREKASDESKGSSTSTPPSSSSSDNDDDEWTGLRRQFALIDFRWLPDEEP